MDVRLLLESIQTYAASFRPGDSSSSHHDHAVLCEWSGHIQRLKNGVNRVLHPHHGERWTMAVVDELMRLYAEGHDPQRIADVLGHTPCSVEYQLSHELTKEMSTNSSAALALKYGREEAAIVADIDTLHNRRGRRVPSRKAVPATSTTGV